MCYVVAVTMWHINCLVFKEMNNQINPELKNYETIQPPCYVVLYSCRDNYEPTGITVTGNISPDCH